MQEGRPVYPSGHLLLEIELCPGPLRGTLSGPGLDRQKFVGWIGLASAIEAARASPAGGLARGGTAEADAPGGERER